MRTPIPICIILLVLATQVVAAAPTVLFQENFEDNQFSQRGWYDSYPTITTAEHVPGSTQSYVAHFTKGASTAAGSNGGRHTMATTDSVYLSYWVKYSANWEGSMHDYHPHEFHFLTTEDTAYTGPALTHLTLYAEDNYISGSGLLAVAATTDGSNIDQSKLKVNLIGVTENRAVSGCNGNPPDGAWLYDCYGSSPNANNGRVWHSSSVVFTDAAGAANKNNWHFVEVYYKLNSISNGIGQSDGIVQMWTDGNLVINHTNVVYRTGAHPNMLFNQFLMLPYIGDGSPVDQYLYFDNITVATGRITTSSGTNNTDTSPPSTPTNLIATPTSSSQIGLTWSASVDNIGVTGYKVYRCQGTGCTPSTQVATPATTSYQDSGLSPSTNYVYRVAAKDAAGNTGNTSTTAQATTQAQNITTAGQGDLNGDGKVDFLDLLIVINDFRHSGATITSAKADINGDGTVNLFDFVLLAKNWGKVYSGTDTTPPVLSSGAPTGTLSAGTTSITMSVTTNENATCKYSTIANTAFTSMTNIFTTTGATAHSTAISGLTSGVPHNYYVRCQDKTGNADGSDYTISFSVASASGGFTTPNILNDASFENGWNGFTDWAGSTPSCNRATDYAYSGTYSAEHVWGPNSADNGCHMGFYFSGQDHIWVRFYFRVTGHVTSFWKWGRVWPVNSSNLGGLFLESGTNYLNWGWDDEDSSIATPIGVTEAQAADGKWHSLEFEYWRNGDPSGYPSAAFWFDDNPQYAELNGHSTITYWGAGNNAYWSNGRLYAGERASNVKIGSQHFMETLNGGNTASGQSNIDCVSISSLGRIGLGSCTQANMTDTTPPTATITTPSANQALAAGTTSTTLSATTNEAATCRYSTSNQAYTSMTNNFTTTGNTAHSTSLTVANGQSYTYYIRCQDTPGNPMTTSQSVSFSVGVQVLSGTYSTNFPLNENPISEGGNWLNGKTDGLDWFNVITNSGHAYGAQSSGDYTDPTAILKGTWTSDQTAQGTVYCNNPNSNYYQEVELRLRSAISAHSITGYEIFFRCLKTSQAYAQIVRWNGPVADFTYLASNTGSQYGVQTGDIVKATIVGNVIKGYINGVEVVSATDNTYTTGNPGMGFNYGVGTTNADFGFTSYSASNLGTDTTPPTATITAPTANQVLAAGTTSTTLRATTNEAATCRYSTSNQAYSSMTQFTTTGGTSHSTSITVASGQSYTYYVRCSDAIGNAMSSSQSISFSVASSGGGTSSYPNEPAGFTKLTERAFNSEPPNGATEDGWTTDYPPYSGVTIVTDPTAPKSPSNVGQALFPKGFVPGTAPVNSEHLLTGTSSTRLYLAFWLKVSQNWYGHSSGTNKIFYVWIDGHPAVYMKLGGGSGTGSLYPQVSTQGTGGGNLDPWPSNVNSNLQVARGQWQFWELLLGSNTAGNADGTLKWWVDGNLIGSYNNVAFASASGSHTWENVVWGPVYGGTSNVPVPADQYQWIDHIYVSTAK